MGFNSGFKGLIRPAFIGWDCLAAKFSGARWLASRPTPNLEDQGLFCQGYHTLAEKSGFKAPDTRLHPPILWWVGFDGYAGQLPAWAFPAISRDTYST